MLRRVIKKIDRMLSPPPAPPVAPPAPVLQESLRPLFDTAAYPLQVSQGRDIGAGHLRGWGLEYGDLLPWVEADPVYQKAFAAASDRGSLLSARKLANLYLILRYARPPGDVYEFGSFRGGSAVFMATVLEATGTPGKVFAFDTFEGMPETDPVRDMHHGGDFSDTAYEGLLAWIEERGLSHRIETVKGRFDDTLPGILARGGQVALSHVDCDIYEPIKYVVRECLPAMAPGGYIVFDDPLHGSCLGAFDAVQELVIRELGLTAEQAFPHLVFRAPPLGA
jgi:predicted O-methyltransferase YrrM